jgi:hypothetical protein
MSGDPIDALKGSTIYHQFSLPLYGIVSGYYSAQGNLHAYSAVSVCMEKFGLA